MKTSTRQLVASAIKYREKAEIEEAEASTSRWCEADCYAELQSEGWSVRKIAAECGTNRQTVSLFCQCVSRYRDSDTRPPFWEAYQKVTEGGKSTAERLVSSDENEWYTPIKYIRAAKKVLGGRIDLDPASCAEANKIIKARKFFTAKDDGMSQPWSGRVWLNPPYGGLAGKFVERLVLEYQADAVHSAICLVNAHCTDTSWFQCLWDFPVCFTDHRIDFDSGSRQKKAQSTHGSVFAYLGEDVAAFKNLFSQYGSIVRKI